MVLDAVTDDEAAAIVESQDMIIAAAAVNVEATFAVSLPVSLLICISPFPLLTDIEPRGRVWPAGLGEHPAAPPRAADASPALGVGGGRSHKGVRGMISHRVSHRSPTDLPP
jgi:hypothetical protein